MKPRPHALISACLLGVPCRYDGASRSIGAERIRRLTEVLDLVPVCPEQLGGLPTPRIPSERVRDGVLTREGTDVSPAFRRGAAVALEMARLFNVRCAILKARSPSCGAGEIYDGSFSGRIIPGDGVTAELLRRHGIPIYCEDQIDALLRGLEEETR